MLESTLRDHLAVSGIPADSAFHTAQLSISFGEAIAFDKLKAAWEAVAAANPSLRTSFAPDESITTTETPSYQWREIDWQASLPSDPAAEWNQIVETDAVTPIASGGETSSRFVVVRLPNGHGHAMWTFHTAILDDDAAANVLQAWLAAYDVLCSGSELPDLQFPAPDAGPAGDDSWKEAFANLEPAPPLIVLPLPESPAQSHARRSIAHNYERPERAEFVKVAESCKTNLEALFGAAWAFVVARATAAGSTRLFHSSSAHAYAQRTEGHLLRVHRVDSNKSARDLIKSFTAESSTAPPPTSLDGIALSLDLPSISAIATFAFRPRTLNDSLQLAMPRWMAADAKLRFKSPAPVTLRVVAGDRPEVSLDYDPATLTDSAAQLLFDLYRGTFEAFVGDPEIELAKFPLPAPEGILEGPEIAQPFRSLVPQCLHEMFSDVAEESPDTVAVQSDTESTTFAQINNLANQFARALRKRGVSPGSKVAISLSSSAEWVALLIGTLRAGGIIVPRPAGETSVPRNTSLLIVDSLPEGAAPNDRILDLSSERSSIHGEKARGIQMESNVEMDAIITDEGGFSFSHEHLGTAFRSASAVLSLSAVDRVLQFSPTNSLASVEEVFSTLLSGATLVIPRDDRWSTRTAFQEFVEANTITALSIPASFCSEWTHYLSELSIGIPASLRVLCVTGDSFPPAMTDFWKASETSAQIILRRACIEAAGLSLVCPLDFRADESHAGTPAPGAKVRIVDRNGLAVPAQLSGNVEIGAGEYRPFGFEAFLSRDDGLLLRDELVPGSVAKEPSIAIQKIAAMHPEIFDAYAEERKIDGKDVVCLWITPRISDHGEPHDFREWFANRLPDPPRRIRAIPRIPLDHAGAVDSTALDELIPDDSAVVQPTRATGSPEEESLRTAICRTLGRGSIGLDETIRDGCNRPDVAARLHEAASRVEPRVIAGDFSRGFSVRSILRAARGREVVSDVAWTPIVPLRAAGRRPPIVFVHDLEGSSKVFEPLAAELGDDQPCFVLTARGLADPTACHETVEQMAASYIEALQRFDSGGTYRLVGLGFGGLVAFEIFAQLKRSGIDAALLTLMATAPPAGKSALSAWKQSLQGFFGKKKPVDQSPRQRRLQESPVYQANEQAASVYAPTALPVEAHIFVPEFSFMQFGAVEAGWRKVCENARFYQVPCTAEEMLEEPAVEAIAAALSSLAASESVEVED